MTDAQSHSARPADDRIEPLSPNDTAACIGGREIKSICRSGLPRKDAVLAQREAWRDRAQTAPSMRSASASEDERWIMGQQRGLSAPSLTSSDALLKESFDYRPRS
jgi:hypothetical protein